AQARNRQQATVLARIPSGWRNNPSQREQVRFRSGEREIVVEYRFNRWGLDLSVDGQSLPAVSREITPELVCLQVDGVERAYRVHHVGDVHYVDSLLGSSELHEIPRYGDPQAEAAAGSLVAPLPGVVNEIKVKPGDQVAAGDVVLVIDSMKV